MATSTSAVYIHVIEDVINKVKEEFVNNGGPGENVLNELQGLWEMKMMQLENKSSSSFHDLNVPYQGTHEEYETPSIETPLQGTAQTLDSLLFNIPTGGTPNEFSSSFDPIYLKSGRPSPFMEPPAPWMNQRPIGVDVNVVYEEGREEAERGIPQQTLTQDFLTVPPGKRKRDEYYDGGFIPERDGAGDATPNGFQIPQFDGPIPDPYEDLSTPNIYYDYQGVVNEDYNVASTPGPHYHDANTPAAVVTQNEVVDDGDDEPLNENDDEDDDDDTDDLNPEHVVMAQFDKVRKTKSKWKCNFRDGIVHINNKVILFNKAAGEFDFIKK